MTLSLYQTLVHRKESETDPNADTPLASQGSVEQTDGQQDCSDIDVDVISDDDEDEEDDDDDDEDLKVSPRSESPRGQYLEDYTLYTYTLFPVWSWCIFF